MKEIPVKYTAIRIDEEKMWNDPIGRIGNRFHYDLETDFPLSETQMKAIVSMVSEFKEGRPCYEPIRFEMRRMVEE